MSAMQTSSKGRAYLRREEGEVLRAYLDPVGVWTIGVGLTAASGVVQPRRGMVITAGEADRLLSKALAKNYEPAVRKAMPGAPQTAFDAAISFHFNTGAIGRASWVGAWKKVDWPAVRAGLLRWTKGGGKVLPGLRARREREFRLMREGLYSGVASAPTPDVTDARIGLPLDAAEIEAVRAGFSTLGYDPGTVPGRIAVVSVQHFQADHDLTIDGIVGRATLSTLQRHLDARRKVVVTSAAGGSLAGAASPAGADLPDYLLWVGAAVLVLISIKVLWSYRDILAARVRRA